MKKKTIISLCVVCFIVGAIAYSSASYYTQKDRTLVRPKINELPLGYDSTSISQLYKIGFSNTKAALSIEAYTQRKLYQEKYGLSFLSNDEMTDFLKKNNFILGDADTYIGEIPANAVKSILDNVRKLHDTRSIYTLTLTHNNLSYELFSDELFIAFIGNRTSLRWEEVLSDNKNSITDFVKPSAIKSHGIVMSDFWTITLNRPSENKVMVVGGAKEFNTTGLQIVEGILSLPVPKDPIAVQKVRGGYVELASWQ